MSEARRPADDLRAFERARWSRQAELLRAWLGALPPIPPAADALERVFAGQDVPDAAVAQMRFDLERDLGRLGAALGGKTPTAVDPSKAYSNPQAFARDEADHTAENALVFLANVGEARDLVVAGAAVVRAQRWIQRLCWELADTDVAAAVPTEFSAHAVAAMGSLSAVRRLAEDTSATLSSLRTHLDVAARR